MEPLTLDLPMGLGMALAENLPALDAFAALTKEQQDRVIAGTHAIRSRTEMQAYVQRLTEKQSL